MATFVHLAPESAVAAIRRGGISASRLSGDSVPPRGVFCLPVVPDVFLTHQWLRELRRRGRERLCGVYFRIADCETVHVGRFHQHHGAMTAAEASALMRNRVGPGLEVIVPRAVTRREILRIKALPQLTGWRFYPEAKGTAPLWPQPGSFGAAKLRTAIIDRERRQEERYFSRFPAEWYGDD